MTTNLPAPIAKALQQLTADLATVHQHATKTAQEKAFEKACAGLVFSYWQALFGHPRALLDRKRESRIIQRLRENGQDVGELLYALDGAHKDPWIMGDDPRANRPYDGIETILRDRAQVEKFAERRKGYRAGKPHPTALKYIPTQNEEPNGNEEEDHSAA